MLCQATQFRDFVNANGTAAQIALMGDASTNWQDENQLLVQTIILFSSGTDNVVC
jgi:iron complex outermembrane receptor protein